MYFPTLRHEILELVINLLNPQSLVAHNFESSATLSPPFPSFDHLCSKILDPGPEQHTLAFFPKVASRC